MTLPRIAQYLRAALIGAIALLAAQPALADLPRPQGPLILTITGQITETNAEGAAEFDLEMLRALPAETIRTTTIWTEGEQEFTGVPLQALLDHVGATGTTLRSVAINDYAVDIPASDAAEGGPILAYERNGAPMSVRDKGPLWIVYPYDSDSRFRTEVIYSRSIWQLNRIDVTD